MSESKFVYVTYIRATADRLWSALTQPEIVRQYWFGIHQHAVWQAGGDWKLVFEDGRVADTGTVVEIDPPKRLVLRWRNEFKAELKREGDSRCVFDIEPAGEAVKLTVTHSIEGEKSAFIEAVSEGWPCILSNLKSLLETGAIVVPA